MITGLGLLMIGRTEPEVFDSVKLRVMEALAPILETTSRPVQQVGHWRDNASRLLTVYEENERLRAELDALRDDATEAQRNAYLVERYQALLNVRLDPNIQYVTARVVGDSGGPFTRALVINAGRRDAIEVGHAVVDAEGLIGRIVSVGDKAARVLLLTDVDSRVPVLLRPSNIRVMLIGDNSKEPTLEFLPNGVTAPAGEAVVTSGHGGLLPPGLPVGRVIAMKEEGDLIRVKLASDFSRLDFVRVVRFTLPQSADGLDIDSEPDSDIDPVRIPTSPDIPTAGASRGRAPVLAPVVVSDPARPDEMPQDGEEETEEVAAEPEYNSPTATGSSAGDGGLGAAPRAGPSPPSVAAEVPAESPPSGAGDL